MRKFEEAVTRLYHEGAMRGVAHLYIGQEAVAAGACVHLRPDDYITSTHRGHCHCLAKGGDPRFMMAEILGKKTGYCKGKGGSMHIFEPSLGILGANGIVGGGIPLATGAGKSIQIRKTDQVVVCFFGDAATNIGAFHEALNMAGLWKLPVVYVCENNLYGISVSQARHQAIKDISDRAAGYGMSGEVVDGSDVEAVADAVKRATDRARGGDGPTLLDCKTYRFGGHHAGDPGTAYRPKEEVEYWKSRCPIKLYRERLFNRGFLDDDTEAEIVSEIDEEIANAVEYARNSELPEPEDAYQDLFACPG